MKFSVVPRGAEFSSTLKRSRLIRGLKERGIYDIDVLAAVDNVPRHRFIDETLIDRAYDDLPLPIGYQQTISQPFIVALMTEKLITNSVYRKTVLEIGTGCGYQTAILAHLYEQVCSIERIEPLYERAKNTLAKLRINNVELRYGDGYNGWKGISNFYSILLTAAPEQLPSGILKQLDIDGCLVAPVGNILDQRLKIVKNTGEGLLEEEAEAVRFVPLVHGMKE